MARLRDTGHRELAAGGIDTHGRGNGTVRGGAPASIDYWTLMHATDPEEILSL